MAAVGSFGVGTDNNKTRVPVVIVDLAPVVVGKAPVVVAEGCGSMGDVAEWPGCAHSSEERIKSTHPATSIP